MTATIHAFPRPTPSASPEQPRLAQALAGLRAALADQRAALHGSVHGLGQALATLNERMGEAATRVAGVGQQSRELEAWADGVLTRDNS
jgi:ABC-type transporter Mla subunit MlaD